MNPLGALQDRRRRARAMRYLPPFEVVTISNPAREATVMIFAGVVCLAIAPSRAVESNRKLGWS